MQNYLFNTNYLYNVDWLIFIFFLNYTMEDEVKKKYSVFIKLLKFNWYWPSFHLETLTPTLNKVFTESLLFET